MENSQQAEAPEAPIPTHVNNYIAAAIKKNSCVRLLKPLQANQQPKFRQ